MKSMQYGNTSRLVASTLCAALTIPMVASAAPTPGPVPPAANQQLARDVLRELIEIRSVHDVGTRATAEAIARRLLTNGFSADEVQVIADEKYPHQVNVVARLKGRGAGKPVMWIGHMDVVEARPEDWSLRPSRHREGRLVLRPRHWIRTRTAMTRADPAAAGRLRLARHHRRLHRR
jgi:hypothetical protein